MKNFVFPTNFSIESRHFIAKFISAYKEVTDFKNINFYLLHAYATAHVGQSILKDLDENLKENAENDLAKEIIEIEKIVGQELSFHTYTRKGDLTSVLHKFDNENELDLVIMPSKENTSFENLLDGTSASQIITSITEPVLFIPSDKEISIPKKIVFATDLKPIKNSKEIDHFLEYVKQWNAELSFVHVSSKKDNFEEIFQKHFSHFLKKHNINSSLEVIENSNSINGLLQFVENSTSDCMALVEREDTFLDKFFHRNAVDAMAKLNSFMLYVLSENPDDSH